MNKRRLVESISAETKLTKTEAGRALDSFVRAVKAALARGERVTLSGFGTFAVAIHKARRVREPRGGTTIEIQARRVARFAAGLELKMALENGAAHAQDDTCDSRSS